jgi:hypothetical protein
MNLQPIPNLSFLTRIEQHVASQPEEADICPAQEQFNGVIPLRDERPAADLLAERLDEADPAGTSLLFVP